MNVYYEQNPAITKLEDYLLITNNTDVNKRSVLEFDPAKSRAICVGIDKQKFLGRNLGHVAAENASLLAKSLVANMGMREECVRVYVSDTDRKPNQLCTKEAIKTLIINYAREVEENGMFVFYFSGHVVVYKIDTEDERVHALVPADFSGDVKTGITADNFVEWIQEADCKARHILIILDCCHAGGIGKKITSAAALDVRPQLHVMCACAAEEVTLPVKVLGNSIFCYFLLHVLNQHQPKGKFALDEDMDEIAELCQMFSSLLMCYSSERDGLKFLMPAYIQPEVHRKVGKDTFDYSEGINSNDNPLSMLHSLYDEHAYQLSLHEVASQWLRSRVVQDPLKKLLSIKPLPESLYNGILCALFYSVSCIHLAYDQTHITERNFFITVAIDVIRAIGLSYSEVSITVEQLSLGLQYFYLPINSVGIQTSSIEKLFMELHAHNCKLTTVSAFDQNMVRMIMIYYISI